MTYRVKLEQFQGPLDLLLQLIEKEELKIAEISLAKVTKQYIDHLETIEELYPEELADFLVIATKLLLLKSRTLLPYLEIDDDEEETDLEEQLRIYREYANASKVVDAILRKGKFSYSRAHIKFQSEEVIFSPPKKQLTVSDLRELFNEALKALEPIVRLPKAAIEKALTMKEKICVIQNLLEKGVNTTFNDLTQESKNKTDIVITFLAILELVKKQMICVKQDEHCEDIKIEKINN
ncbi:MAG: ScpA family protein [Patescibacteria group bacterium]